MYAQPYETPAQRRQAVVALQQEYEFEVAENIRATAVGLPEPYPETELKTRKVDRKGGIDWYIYRERIRNPHLYPSTQQAIQDFPDRDIMIIEDNAPAHIHHYHNIPRERLGLQKLVWPANSPDLNPIKTIWTELKDKLQDQIGPRMTAREICRVLEQVSVTSLSTFYFYFYFLSININLHLGVAKLPAGSGKSSHRINAIAH